MESLMRVMAAKKRELSTIKAEKATKNEKYLRRGDVEELLYAQEQQRLQEEAAAKKRKLDTTKTSRDGKDSTASSSADASNRQEKQESTETAQEDEALISSAELRRRLRDLGQPVTLFGESKRDRMARLRRVETEEVTRREDKVDDAHAMDSENAGHGSSGGGAQDDLDRDDDDDDREDKGTKRALDGERDGNGSADDAGDEQDDVKTIYRFFKDMLRRWEQDLADRPDHVRRTAQGKMATKTMKQCKDYIRPLLKLCKRREVPADILPSLVDIVRFCKEGEFVQAHDAYIKLAIGNAAWPIGVTMVGIHERTGREKINANKQAHVMNNEAQRKYITSVKRLISYAQSVSSVLPSKKVM